MNAAQKLTVKETSDITYSQEGKCWKNQLKERSRHKASTRRGHRLTVEVGIAAFIIGL